MILSLIVAYTKDLKGRYIIGKDGKLPWKIPADMTWFRECTSGSAIIMGRKTYESIGRPLPKRDNIILSSDPEYKVPGAHTFTDLEKALVSASNFSHEVFIIGGQTLYEQCLDRVERLYITCIKDNPGYKGDTYFPVWNQRDFKIIQSDTTQDEKNGSVTYEIFQRYKYTHDKIDPMQNSIYNTGGSGV